MGYIREAKKAGSYEDSFATSKEIREASSKLYEGQRWVSDNGEGVRFAFTDVPLPLLEVQIEPIFEIPTQE